MTRPIETLAATATLHHPFHDTVSRYPDVGAGAEAVPVGAGPDNVALAVGRG
ncbi:MULTISPECIES: hypothetical protein [unclassified Streptomyces]|uniref:hypothetical protein n=1 Tax=unclassified Streptomyces TaxID=2593676 RepID=UPI0023651AB1|nr:MULTISPECIES: hypothetical protein [unclassified Streptomyces]MDF3143066.1 hypothetical protein [Streptomyces sp. T21Q-yed]WDF43023.1 hypothetical protein PBV52_42640 [Streptomyces sp. T12]